MMQGAQRALNGTYMKYNGRLIGNHKSQLGVAFIFLALAMPIATAQDNAGLITTPTYTALSPFFAVPPFLDDRLVYYNSFDSPDGKPDLDRIAAQQPGKFALGPSRLLGRCAITGAPGAIRLRAPAFSPHRPLTVSFWWALREDAKVDGAFALFQLTNGRGFVSHFSRGKGEWCALQRPAGVLQVYNLPGIANVNGIYDYDLLAHLDLKAGVWHHTALTFSSASVVTLYTDGKPVYTVHLRGRAFAETDALHDLTIGAQHGAPMAIDDLLILTRVLLPEEIAGYVRGIMAMKAVNYP